MAKRPVLPPGEEDFSRNVDALFVSKCDGSQAGEPRTKPDTWAHVIFFEKKPYRERPPWRSVTNGTGQSPFPTEDDALPRSLRQLNPHTMPELAELVPAYKYLSARGQRSPDLRSFYAHSCDWGFSPP